MTSAEVQRSQTLRETALSTVEALAAEHARAYETLAQFANFVAREFAEELEDYVADRSEIEEFVPNAFEFSMTLMKDMKESNRAAAEENVKLRRELRMVHAEAVTLKKITEILNGVRGDPESGL